MMIEGEMLEKYAHSVANSVDAPGIELFE